MIERNISHGNLYTGFCTLVQLFLHVQRPLVLPAIGRRAIEAPDMYSKDSILDIQRQVHVRIPRLELTSELQYVDILTTSAWVRSLLWQYAASRFMLSSSTSIEPLSFDYPLSIAKDYLECLSHVSIESMRSHGYGMVRNCPLHLFRHRRDCGANYDIFDRRSSFFKSRTQFSTLCCVCQTFLTIRRVVSGRWMRLLRLSSYCHRSGVLSQRGFPCCISD